MTFEPCGRARFCWRCAGPLDHPPPTRCASCGQEHFNNPKPAGCALVVKDGEVLLVQRATSPWLHHWDVPGGFCDVGEHPMAAARRELAEETGLVGEPVAFIGMWLDVYGAPAPDGAQEMTLNAHYLFTLQGPFEPRLNGEVCGIDWYPLDEPPVQLAFPDHTGAVFRAARSVYRLGSYPALLDRPAGDG